MRRNSGHPDAPLLELTLAECCKLGTMGYVFLQTKELPHNLVSLRSAHKTGFQDLAEAHFN